MGNMYRYFISGSPSEFTNYKDKEFNYTSEVIKSEFYNSPTYRKISYEEVMGTSVYNLIDTRVTTSIDPSTSQKLNNDFRTIYFLPEMDVPKVGAKFQFDDNIWIVVDRSYSNTPINSVMVRRCNNVLKWLDYDTGKVFSEPCVIDYLSTVGNDDTGLIKTPTGKITIFVQKNKKTNTIKENQRFIFGNKDNRVCYKILSGGLINYNNLKTSDDNSSTLLKFYLEKNFINEEFDNIELGVADYYKIMYSISISPSIILGGVGDSFSLTGIVYKNNVPVNYDISFSLTNPSIGTISGSNVLLLTNTGTGCLVGRWNVNTDIYKRVTVISGSSQVINESIVVNPASDKIYEGEEIVYSVYLYENGVQTSETFSFSIINNIPSENYEFEVINGNYFRLKNKKKYLDEKLKIKCDNPFQSIEIEILLTGKW